MKLLKYLLPFLAIMISITGPVFAQRQRGTQDGSRFLEELNERDWQVLTDFINSKRTIDVEERACVLTVSGDVRTEWRHMTETDNGNRLRGRGAKLPPGHLPISKNDFDIEFNLRFDYVCDRAWAVAQLQFDNSAGVDNDRDCEFDPRGYHGSGRCNSLCLKRAYMGYNVITDGDARFDVELGRRQLYATFDSKVQFNSRFDGILLKYSNKLKDVADWYWNTAGFVVDERVDHFAWASEIGFLNIMDKGVDLKYSFIDWQKRGKNRCFKRNPVGFRFLVSQWTAAYHFNREWFCDKPAKLYGAFLYNHFPGKAVFRRNDGFGKKEHKKAHHEAWYVGFTIGEVITEGDWAFDIQYQWVGALAMPDDDMGGIGRGNTLDGSVTANGKGNTNFRGVHMESLYALTDNLSINTILEWSRQIQKSIGGRHTYSKFEVEAIYAF